MQASRWPRAFRASRINSESVLATFVQENDLVQNVYDQCLLPKLENHAQGIP